MFLRVLLFVCALQALLSSTQSQTSRSSPPETPDSSDTDPSPPSPSSSPSSSLSRSSPSSPSSGSPPPPSTRPPPPASGSPTSGARTPGPTPTDGCCATCIGKNSNIPYTYDPVIHNQCSSVKGVCCYNCAKDGDSKPDVLNAVGFGDDGTTPQIENGHYIQLEWNSVERVTYEFYSLKQKKITTVRNASTEARKKNNFFFICAARGEGKVVLRGWGKDPCTSATEEAVVEIVPSKSDKSPKCTSGSAEDLLNQLAAESEQKDNFECNKERAYVDVADDKTKTCVCLGDYTGPPTCSKSSWWKTAATIGGAIAAALSIAVSVKAFLANQKNKRDKAETERKNQEELDNTAISYQEPSSYAYEQPRTVRPPETKEYTL
uniref:Uncharacterized protein AlNc14C26G2571 n=1 Tax=Albugo laibachii Nc14 TaxID=890382 RepID=F0W6T5_9STRA|nr:conserved hypothetical protein [Albugo laibachii Nc14]|eukprot:CCA16830.1 conserved hypothetical protein [Albugo laibachii Nc14]